MPSRKIFSVCLFVSLFLLLAGLALADDAEQPKLTVSPDSLFFRVMATTAPPAQKIAVSARGGTLGAFTAVAATNSGGDWLSVSPTSGSGPGTLTVMVNITGLAAGEYEGAITIMATGFTSAKAKVELEIGGMMGGTLVPTLIVRPKELDFHAVEGGPAPKSLPVAVSSSVGASFSWTAEASVSTPAGGKWLKVSPTSGTGTGVLQVTADPTGLSKGEYNGQITVKSGSNTAKVDVELEIEAARAAKLVINPRAFNFIIEPNSTKTPEPKTLEVKNAGGGTFSWKATAAVSTPAGGKWLSIDPPSGSGPGKITVKVDPTGLAADMYSGKITVTAGSDSAEALVFLRILGPSKPRVQVTPKAVIFSVSQGKVSPDTRTVKVDSKSSGLTFTAAASTAKGGNWLKITPTSGPVPGSITVSVDSAVALALSAGVYTGKIEVKVPGAAQEVSNVHAALKVFGAGETPRLEVEPGGLAFTATVGGSNPAAKKLKLEAEGAASIAWTAAVSVASPSGGNWLSITPTSGAAPGEVSVSANITGLALGAYTGSIVFTPAASSGAPPVTVPVALVIAAAAARPTSLQVDGGLSANLATGPLVAFFSGPPNGFITQVDLPLNVSVTVLDSTGAPVEGATVVVSSSNGEPDLVLADLGGGEYTGVFRALSSGALTLTGSAQSGGVTSSGFAVNGDMESATPTLIYQDGAVSAASFAASPTPLAPGSLVSVFGLGIAGNGGAASSVPLPFSLGGVSVTIGGVNAPLVAAVAASSDQINLQVPFELQGVAQADVVVNSNGVLSTPETISIAPAVPALFTFSQNGTGPGAILHANFGAVSRSSPAAAGEVVLLYATGLGAVQPAVGTGAATAGQATVTGVQVTVGGVPAEVQFAGLAPGFVGLYQINVKVPAGVASGDALVVVSVNGTPATGRATMAVR